MAEGKVAADPVGKNFISVLFWLKDSLFHAVGVNFLSFSIRTVFFLFDASCMEFVCGL